MTYEQWPYLGVFAILVATGLGLPVPEDVPLLTAGYLCHAGYARIYVMIALAMVGVLSGDIILFSIGRRFGHHVVEHRFVRRLVHPYRLLMAERMFARHGIKIIFAGRFMPVLRPMIFMASGVLKVPWATFLAVDGFAACISVPALIILGKVFGDNLKRIQGDVRAVTHLIVLGAAALILIAAGIYLHRRQKRLVARAGPEAGISRDTLAHIPPAAPVPTSEPEPEHD